MSDDMNQHTSHPFGFYDSRWGNPVWVWPQVRHYPNGRLAIQLFSYSAENNFIEPWATVTVNLPDQAIPENTVCVKDYSENDGLLELLIQSNIVEPKAVLEIPSGFVLIPVHPLTENFLTFALETVKC